MHAARPILFLLGLSFWCTAPVFAALSSADHGNTAGSRRTLTPPLDAPHPALVQATTGRRIPALQPPAVARVNRAGGSGSTAATAPGAPQMLYPRPFPCTNAIRTVALFQECNPWGSTLLPYLLTNSGISYVVLGTND
ncbi:MAG: hypothetical protein NTV22_02875, partial [bacterium]|nr:hypothetical protein [bacterium]